MARGGYRPGAGRKKGTKNNKIEKGSEQKRIVLVKKLIKLLNNRIQKSKSFKCEQCGKLWQSTRKGPRKYCSDNCRKIAIKNQNRFKEKICVKCGKSFKTQNGAKYCSGDCYRQVFSEERRKKRPVYQCRKCGKEFFRPKSPTASLIFCSRECAGTGIIGKAKRTDPRAGNNYKRAKLYGVNYESVNKVDVFERDGWRCQICGKLTPKEKRGTKCLNAPELDHRIPISRGGPHTYSNVQCSCHKCNSIKSNKYSVGQLPIFGRIKW
jgi:hypothetical protein